MNWRDYFEITKPNVVYLIVFTAIVGTLLASPGWPPLGPLGFLLALIFAPGVKRMLRRELKLLERLSATRQ